ncbi:MAG: tyrosine--tRNA ligase [Phycisphaerales bacterium]|nr:tyrosine--tRNA ligase [Phycisphaerales bacterium]
MHILTLGSFLQDLHARNLLQQVTHEDALRQHLASADLAAGGRRAYVGFDPTADSLTIGNLVGIMALARWQRAGHTPIVVAGGGTGFVGDPSGKSAERTLQTPEQIKRNVEGIKKIFSRVIEFDGSVGSGGPLVPSGSGSGGSMVPSGSASQYPLVKNPLGTSGPPKAHEANLGLLLDNYDWLSKLSFLEALRDVGKHFSVNMMMAKESVKERLHNRDQGISFTEFSYMILQAYDFAFLHEHHGVTVQMGGSDQFGNIVCGIDLIGKNFNAKNAKSAKGESEDRPQAFGITWPLVTKADGTKFGKTESGAIWLTAKQDEHDTSPNRTSPYQFYQFWLNAADADVSRFLKTFTLLPIEEIHELEQGHATDPAKRDAQRALAQHMTDLLHGREEREKAEHAAKALFSKSSGDDGPFVLPEDVLSSAPSTTHERSLLAGTGMSLVDLLPLTTLAKSKTEARTHLGAGAVSVNGRVAALDARVTEASLLPGGPSGGVIALRRGKKTWHVCRWV